MDLQNDPIQDNVFRRRIIRWIQLNQLEDC